MLQQTPTDSTSAIAELADSPAVAQFIDRVHDVTNFTLFPLGDQDVTVVTLIVVALVLLVTWWISRILQRAVAQMFRTRGITDRGTTAVAQRFLHYGVMLVGTVMAIQQVGLDLGALFAAGAIFAVALGFAMQGVAENFLSGLILLVERDIRNGDILEVEGRDVRVVRMGIRSTVARSRDDEDLIIPNALLTREAVKNFTRGDSVFRIRVTVGVTYGSDMRKVREVLEGVGRESDWRYKANDPVVLMRDFGDSSVVWELSVWSDEPWKSPQNASRLREGIWFAFQESEVVIAFPQLDVHFDAPVEDAFTTLQKSA